jgi:hypothetical protein
LRASVAAERPRKGLEGTVQRALLRLFEILLKIMVAWPEKALMTAAAEEAYVAGAWRTAHPPP